VSSLPAPPSERINYHIVSSGESLMTIAWRYELELDALATANGLVKPYRLKTGQRLTLDLDQRRPSVATVVQPTVGKPRSASVPATGHRVQPTKASPPTSSRQAPSPTPALSASTTAKSPVLPKQAEANAGAGMPLRWQWPVKGSFTRSYDTNNTFRGISIRSEVGRPVSAAAAGEVVFAAGGLPGYGQLLIIKHNAAFYSAYAHNRKLLVREGAMVKAGQTISEVGGEPASPGRFYFEIRERGKPVDPLRFLPRL